MSTVQPDGQSVQTGEQVDHGAQFRLAMRRPAQAVAVIATGKTGERAGVTVTAVCSLSDDPPSILVCIHRRSSALIRLREARAFSVNFLASDQADLAELFAGRSGHFGDDRFADEKWTALKTGAPVLRDALVSFDCRLQTDMEVATHAVLTASVVAIEEGREGRSLVYSQRSFGRFEAFEPQGAP